MSEPWDIDPPNEAGKLRIENACCHEEIKRQAAEIERLRAALRRWQQSGCPDCGGDCSSANPPVACCIVQETRAALAAPSHASGVDSGAMEERT